MSPFKDYAHYLVTSDLVTRGKNSFSAAMSEVSYFCVREYLSLFTLVIIDRNLLCYNVFKIYRLHPHTFSFLKYQIVAKNKIKLYHPSLGMLSQIYKWGVG